jgi:hypothetical protein
MSDNRIVNDSAVLDDAELDVAVGGLFETITAYWNAVQECARDPLCDDIPGAHMPVKK